MLKQLGRLERTRNIVILGICDPDGRQLVIFYAPGRNAAISTPAKTRK